MDPQKLYTEFGLDERLGHECAYCGLVADTADHVPSRVLLDDPLPADLPVVPACAKCNRGFSKDEEYVACFLECVLAGVVEPDRLRPKISAALRHSSRLAAQIASSARADAASRLLWTPDLPRVANVVVKLARGHAMYEGSSSHIDPPRSVTFTPFLSMTIDERDDFERAGAGELCGWPELGSRAFLRAAGLHPSSDQVGPWVQVQAERYRYSVDEGSVRIVLSEYLACRVEWT